MATVDSRLFEVYLCELNLRGGSHLKREVPFGFQIRGRVAAAADFWPVRVNPRRSRLGLRDVQKLLGVLADPGASSLFQGIQRYLERRAVSVELGLKWLLIDHEHELALSDIGTRLEPTFLQDTVHAGAD
jgi:hypothetical protein